MGKALHGARWGTVISFNYSNYRCRNTQRREERSWVALPMDGAQQRPRLSSFISPDIRTCKNTSQERWSQDTSLLWNLIFVSFFASFHLVPDDDNRANLEFSWSSLHVTFNLSLSVSYTHTHTHTGHPSKEWMLFLPPHISYTQV